MSTELQVVKEGSFAVAAPGGVGAAFVQAAFEQGATALTFDKSSVPAGGGTMWSVPSLSGEQAATAIEGVIAFMQARQRAWWKEGIEDGGGSQPPSCSSVNAIVGIGDNSIDGTANVNEPHECAKCPWGAFGSSRKGGNGKDCKEFARLFVFRPNSRMPLVVTVPPTSLKEMQRYAMRLLDAGLMSHQAVTRLKLVPEKNAAGIRYSKITFEFVGALPESEQAAMDEVMKAVREGVSSRTVTVEASDVNG